MFLEKVHRLQVLLQVLDFDFELSILIHFEVLLQHKLVPVLCYYSSGDNNLEHKLWYRRSNRCLYPTDDLDGLEPHKGDNV